MSAAATFAAMMFARRAHANQVRKYTGNPYTDHLAEVAGIVAAVGLGPIAIATAWLHDCIEDQGIKELEIETLFGADVVTGVLFLSDMETEGNRAARKAAARDRLSRAPGWVQTIKVADLISNTSSIVKHDPEFAKVYLEEKRLLLDVLTQADARLVRLAREQIGVATLAPATARGAA